jgi:hypothetical protein
MATLLDIYRNLVHAEQHAHGAKVGVLDQLEQGGVSRVA